MLFRRLSKASSVEAQQRDNSMSDLIFIGLAIAFFLISVGYVNGCEKLRGVPRD